MTSEIIDSIPASDDAAVQTTTGTDTAAAQASATEAPAKTAPKRRSRRATWISSRPRTGRRATSRWPRAAGPKPIA